MNTTRNGKIARLPRTIRDELSDRINNGQSGPKLIKWLNALPEVQTVLAEYFAGRSINRQNITEWRQGGYQEWLELQETRTLTLELVKDAATLEQDHTQQKMTQAFTTISTAAFIRTARTKLKACADVNQRWDCLDEIENRLSRLNRNQCRTGNLTIRQQRWDAQAEDREKAGTEAADAEDRRQKLLYFELQPEVKKLAHQSGENAKTLDLSTFLLELKHNLPTGFLTQKPAAPDSSNPSATPNSATRAGDQGCLESRLQAAGERASGSPEPTPAPTPTSDIANNSRITHHASPAPVKPETTQKTPEIRVNQAAADRSINHETPTRPSCQPSTAGADSFGTNREMQTPFSSPGDNSSIRPTG